MSKKALRFAPWILTLPLCAPSHAAPAGAQASPPQAAPAPAQPPARQYSPEEEGEARVFLGEQFCELAQTVLTRGARLNPLVLRQSAALLEAATRMNPYEPRYPRLLAEALERLGDIDGAIGAWGVYRKLLPDDQVAQVELINLYLGRLQTNDAKIKYLADLIDRPTLAPEVKARLAAIAVPLLNQRSEAEARAMLRRAREFRPPPADQFDKDPRPPVLLPEVALLQLRMLPPDASAAERFSALLDVLRTNPTQPFAIAGVADMLAEAGLSEQALTWYAALMDVHVIEGTNPTLESVVNYTAEQFRAGETTSAAQRLDAILQAFPNFTTAWLLRLTVQRSDQSPQLINKARQAMIAALNGTADEVLKRAAKDTERDATSQPAATEPSDARPPATQSAVPALDASIAPNVAQAIARARESKTPALIDALANVLGEMAWLELYFDHRADAASPYIDAIRSLRSSDDPLVRRLEAWHAFVSGHLPEARTGFVALREKDPLAALGLFQLEEQEKHEKESQAVGRQLLSEPHSGLLGAILWQATKGRGLKPATQPAAAGAIQKALEQFPAEWMQIVRQPKKFYSIRAEPLKVGHKLGEPLLAGITIKNTSHQDLIIGDAGVVKPDLFFDAQIRGSNPQMFPGIAVDQIMGRFVLHPGESQSQLVRIDQGPLAAAMRDNPAMTIRVAADVVSNAEISQGMVKAQAAGFAENFSSMFTRSASPMRNVDEQRKFILSIDSASAGVKMQELDVLASYVRAFVSPDATAAQKSQQQQYLDILDKERSDPAPGVKIWANYLLAVAYTGPQERKLVDDMMGSSAWESRLLGLYAAQFLAVDAQKQIAAGVAATEKDVLVKNFAVAMASLSNSAATQPAATQPTTHPDLPAQAPASPPAAPPGLNDGK